MAGSDDLRSMAGATGWQAAPPARRPVLFVNPRSGGGTARRPRIAERARERGIEAVILQPGQSLSKLVGEAVAGGADTLGMAGGDGSLAVVAEAQSSTFGRFASSGTDGAPAARNALESRSAASTCGT